MTRDRCKIVSLGRRAAWEEEYGAGERRGKHGQAEGAEGAEDARYGFYNNNMCLKIFTNFIISTLLTFKIVNIQIGLGSK